MIGIQRHYGQGRITVGPEFPLKPGELLRVRLGGSRELRVKVGTQISEKPSVFGTTLYEHEVPNNKEQITLEGTERRLRRV